MYDAYDIDKYATGTNAVVAVISHTGYDMEDAMIVNKGAMECGFAHGSIYMSHFIDLKDKEAHDDDDILGGGKLSTNATLAMAVTRNKQRNVTDDENHAGYPIWFSNKLKRGDGEPIEYRLDTDGMPHIGTKLVKGMLWSS